MHLASGQPSMFNYQWQVKQALDPNDLGDEYYETLDGKPPGSIAKHQTCGTIVANK